MRTRTHTHRPPDRGPLKRRRSRLLSILTAVGLALSGAFVAAPANALDDAYLSELYGPYDQSYMEFVGIDVYGYDFPANAAITMRVDGQPVPLDDWNDPTTDSSGFLQQGLSGQFTAGTHTLTVTAGGESASQPFTVEAGGYDPNVQALTGYSQWDMKYDGVKIWGSGFPGDSTIRVYWDGIKVGEMTAEPGADANGDFGDDEEVLFTRSTSAGTHVLKLEANIPGGGTVTYTEDVEVESDASFWDSDGYFLYTLLKGDGPTVVSQAKLSSAPMTIEAHGFPSGDAVEVRVNGALQGVVRSTGSIFSSHDYTVTGPRAAGPVKVDFTHPVGTVSYRFDVVPNTQGTKPRAGDYLGTSTQTGIGGASDLGTGTNDFGFSVDNGGRMTLVAGPYLWACTNYSNPNNQNVYNGNFAEVVIPATALTVNRPFDIHWTDTYGKYTIKGKINANGTASGTATANPLGESNCLSTFEWSVKRSASSGGSDTGFTDVTTAHQFATEILWMAAEGITTGKKQKDGSVKFDPKGDVTREAMAAFMYRLYATDAEKKSTKSVTSYFSDVKPGDPFAKEIAWMYASGTSTGIKQKSGKPAFAPKSSITREAMAAFMYRLDDGKKSALPSKSPFVDMRKGDKFYREIVWMKQSGLSTGKKQSNGSYKYDPKGKTTREAMAAFLYRAEH